MYNLNDQIEEDEVGRACGVNGGEKEPLGLQRHRYLDNITMYLLDWIGWCGLDWSGSR
jgi:hypothetical protein